jgi:hypothetical protein
MTEERSPLNDLQKPARKPPGAAARSLVSSTWAPRPRTNPRRKHRTASPRRIDCAARHFQRRRGGSLHRERTKVVLLRYCSRVGGSGSDRTHRPRAEQRARGSRAQRDRRGALSKGARPRRASTVTTSGPTSSLQLKRTQRSPRSERCQRAGPRGRPQDQGQCLCRRSLLPDRYFPSREVLPRSMGPAGVPRFPPCCWPGWR